jgi:pimeloyl-ACP methyl ester carboxylesterase
VTEHEAGGGGALARLDAWRASGSTVPVPCSTGGAAVHPVWFRVSGAGPWLTVIHGFPTSSFDMAEVVEEMSASRRVLAFDMIGFGESDRPADHVYSVSEQADAVAALWALHGVRETAVLAHDLGASVAQELLHRALHDALGGVRLRAVVLANGGIFPDLHRPLPFQTALADPETGAAVAAAITEEAFAPSLLLTFGPAHAPSPDELRAMWSTISRAGGHRNLHLLIRYMEERRERSADWVGALTSTPVPLGFVWGMLDPISGAHIAERIVAVLPGAPRRLLDDAGHWPPLEAPAAVIKVLREVDPD